LVCVAGLRAEVHDYAVALARLMTDALSASHRMRCSGWMLTKSGGSNAAGIACTSLCMVKCGLENMPLNVSAVIRPACLQWSPYVEITYKQNGTSIHRSVETCRRESWALHWMRSFRNNFDHLRANVFVFQCCG